MKSKDHIVPNLPASAAAMRLIVLIASCALSSLASAGSSAVYVAIGAGSFYDKPIQFKDHPSDTDYVCASSNAAGIWTSSMGRPCDYFLWSNIPSTQSIATCDTSSGSCKNQNGGIETYVVKASISGSTPTPPVVVPPVGGPGQFTVTWPPVLKGTKNEDVSKDITGYCIYYGLTVGSMATKYCVGNVYMATVTNLPAGFYYLQMTAVAGIVESDKTSAGSVNVTGASPPPIPPTVSIYHVKAIAAGARPATEAVLAPTGTAQVLGYKLGDILVGRPCGDTAIIKSGSNEYHAVSESDVELISPTYKGRQLVAVCGK